MMHETLSQFMTDPETKESYDVVVPSNWLKKTLRDYEKLVRNYKETQTELNKLSAFLDYRTEEVKELKEQIALMESTSTLTRIDIRA